MSFNNNYYWKISGSEFNNFGWGNFSEREKSEILKISPVLKSVYFKIYGTFRRKSSRYSRMEVEIKRLEDEWYLVKCQKYWGPTEWDSDIYYYKCDQIDGIKELLKKVITSNFKDVENKDGI